MDRIIKLKRVYKYLNSQNNALKSFEKQFNRRKSNEF
tara:strand:- start:3432 stop:3542 length:111 start_codon:yes stop_codon:yes gene_type:complete